MAGSKTETGGRGEDRTPDLLHAMQALSQLSYTPVYLMLGSPQPIFQANSTPS